MYIICTADERRAMHYSLKKGYNEIKERAGLYTIFHERDLVVNSKDLWVNQKALLKASSSLCFACVPSCMKRKRERILSRAQ